MAWSTALARCDDIVWTRVRKYRRGRRLGARTCYRKWAGVGPVRRHGAEVSRECGWRARIPDIRAISPYAARAHLWCPDTCTVYRYARRADPFSRHERVPVVPRFDPTPGDVLPMPRVRPPASAPPPRRHRPTGGARRLCRHARRRLFDVDRLRRDDFDGAVAMAYRGGGRGCVIGCWGPCTRVSTG